MESLISILGAGESGVGAALLAQQKGFEVWVSDKGTIKGNYKEELEKAGLPYEEGGHNRQKIFESLEVIKSPGIPDTVPLIRDLKAAGIPVISEIEFAGRYTEATIIGITGSNGKTTTTRLLHHLLKTAALDSVMAGNVGNSFARELTRRDPAVFVLELSSFQLDGIVDFRPQFALLLNISPDHLDRYDYKMENYVAAKFRIGMNQLPEDVLLLNADNSYIREELPRRHLLQQIIPVHNDGWKDRSFLVNGQEVYLKNPALKGKHNFFNAKIAAETAQRLGVSAVDIQKGLDSFVNAPHRLEWVGEVNGIGFINDSKGTNIDAVYYALEAMDRPIVWVAGGLDKGNDYSIIEPLIREKARALVCLGADNSKLLGAFSHLLPDHVECRTAEDAVREAYKRAKPGDVVLLSPACSSFDLFENFAARGDQFREAALELIEREKKS
jgi:UDP-N-acetylmuramoylalanine--D-glutamate ligase